jgi:tripeptide aminopeptidase
LQYECFNGARAIIDFKGKAVHPGTAKNKMINAVKLAMEFNDLLPASEAPEYTDGYEGFYHLISLNGDVEQAQLYYIIRDHDKAIFNARKVKIEEITKQLQEKYGEERIILDLEDTYYNMAEKIEPVKEIVDLAEVAMRNLDIEPIFRPMRGGTDGSQLSFMGLPCPNIFQGGENFHGRYEFASLNDMEKATQVILEIVKLHTAKYL